MIAAEYYWISFYGTPSETSPWGWRFGGHHLGLNLSVEGNRVTSMSPSFVGAKPTIIPDRLSPRSTLPIPRKGCVLLGRCLSSDPWSRISRISLQDLNLTRTRRSRRRHRARTVTPDGHFMVGSKLRLDSP